MKTCLRILTLLFCTFTLSAQEIEKKLDQLITQSFNTNNPGAAVLVSHKGNVIYKKTIGQADLENNIPLEVNSVFEIGSITKQFTAVAILQLAEKNLINLQDPITKYLPDFDTKGNTITIHHLLTHTSGLNNFTSEDTWADEWRKDLSLEKTIELFKNKPLEFEPGEKFSYCNSGYVLLGAVIEKVSGETYENYLQKNIFNPIGMNDTYFGSRSKIIKKRARGYQKNGEFINAEYVTFSQTHAAGALMSTIEDLLKWNKELYNYRILSKKFMELAATNYTTNNGNKINYGYGWFINEIEGLKSMEHGGGIFGFLTYALYVPTEDLFVTVLTNYDRYNPESIAVNLATIALNKENKNVNKSKLNPKIAKKFVGSYKFDDTLIRNIILENDTLYSQLSGGNKISLTPLSENEFLFNGIGNATIKFKIQENNTVIAIIKNRLIMKTGVKIEKKEEEYKTISVNEELLKNYMGQYKIPPSLTFNVFVKNKNLYIQFPNQPEIEAYATSETEFFTKLGDAKIQFIKLENETNFKLILKQNGQTFNALKIGN